MVKNKIVPFEKQINPGIDRNDPQAAQTAIEIRFPDTFSDRAWKVIRYFEGAMFLYAYKGKFVVTDESLYLTDHGDGTHEAPLGGPRWTGNSLEELEQWLLSVADAYDDDTDEVAGWRVEKAFEPLSAVGQEPSPNVLVNLIRSNQFIGIKTYCRKYGSHGRFLIHRDTLIKLTDAHTGKTSCESDCGNYCQITRLNDALQFSFAWLNIYSDGSVKGIRQDIMIPLFKIGMILHWKRSEKYLYIPPMPTAKVITFHASAAIREISQDKRLRRAFSKAMRDCFRWSGEEVTLYRDGKYSFYFITRSGFPKCGGLILHEGEREGHPYIYYSVHT